MTDRELLELAAMAAGIEFIGMWNPLSDDGDAFRLAVKLELRLGTHCNDKMACASDIHGRCEVQVVEWGDDKYAANRLAIVLCAAEIGKEM